MSPVAIRIAASLAVVLAGVVPQGKPHAAGVFKCRGAEARPVYQDRPCASGEELRNLTLDPPPMSVVPFAFEPPPSPRPARAERSPKPRPPTRADRRRLEAERRLGDAEVAERRHLKDGMTDGEVLARLGPPDLQSGKGARRTRWTYLPAPGDPQTLTVVRFEDGRVVAVDRAIVR